MNRMWIRLSLTYGAVVMIAFIAVAAISLALFRYNVERTTEEDRQFVFDGISAQLATYYETNGNWTNVASVFTSAESLIPMVRGQFFILRSVDGDVLYGNPPPDVTMPVEGEVDSMPIVIDGTTEAYLAMPSPKARELPLLGIARGVGIEELLILTAITVAVISILFGVIISRWLTAPLDNLTATARQIGEGMLDLRVHPSGTAETDSLAHSFNAMIERLEQSLNLRRNLVADVAHELRTPISALQAGLYAILDDAYPMTKKEIAGLYEQSRMLSRLVNDLHELSQAEANQLPLNRQPLDVSKTLEDLVAPFGMVAESKDITLKVEIQPGLPILSADASRINQVLNNLLSNALRHTPAGGTITISVTGTPDCVQIAVRDTGDGITAEHLPHVFERFYRGDYGRSRDAGGTGLGLAIARAITEAHQGTLDVFSAGIPGQGTAFQMVLPAK